jgi:iron complex outermembrane recepter protein
MKLNKAIVFAGASTLALVAANSALAQSTASVAVDTVIVKGTRNVGILQKESGVKTKVTVDQALISTASAGQTIAEVLNTVPGFNFTNNDAYGSSGGNVTMRGISGDKISLTFDGAQLNDSGNYAIYTNQMLEPELICSASVSTGATDADSMTASAIGGTVNFATCRPEDKFGGVVKLSHGENDFNSAYLRIDTGRFGPFGTKAFAAITDQAYDTWTRETSIFPGELKKKQYNFMISQDLFDNGSFVNLSGHYNENRNRFYSAFTAASLNAAPTATTGYDLNTASPISINPSNTGNLKIRSKINLNDKLTFTFDPTYQYVLATGGSQTNLSEKDASLCGATFVSAGCVDINKDGDKVDSVAVYNSNITNTNRGSVTSSLIYRFADNQRLRFGLSYDNARHRQTGERAKLNADGTTPNVFGAKEDESLAIITNDGFVSQRRDRLSKAIVSVASLEYLGSLFDNKLTYNLAARAQKMERDLNQNCYSVNNGSGSFSPYCSSEAATAKYTSVEGYKVVTLASKGTTEYVAPYHANYSFEKTLFSGGATYRVTPSNQVYLSISQSMASPKVDNYYAIKIDPTTKIASVSAPDPEVNDSFEGGYRFTSPKLYATANVFYSKDKDRLVSAYDELLGQTIDTNVGDVVRSGFEALASYKPAKSFGVNASYSYTSAEMQNDLPVYDSVAKVTTSIATTGKQLVETPKHMGTLGVTYTFADQLTFNVAAKYVGERFATLVNDAVAPDYTVVNFTMRYAFLEGKEGTYLQLNVNNLTGEKYFGSINNKPITALGTKRANGSTEAASAPTYYAGAPATYVVSLRHKF